MLIASGQKDLASGNGSLALGMVKQKIPAFTVAAYFHKDAQTLVARADDGVHGPANCKGRGQ